jgi:Flp pilus assembly protein TadB
LRVPRVGNSFCVRREQLNRKLESAVRERPALWHVLDLRVVTRAVIAAIVAGIVFWLLIGPAAAAVVLLLVYFGGWALLARLSYDERRETKSVDAPRGEARTAGAS